MFRIRLKELREQKDISQATLGRIVGVSQSTVGMWESGESFPRNATLEKLSKYFGVSIDFLLGHDLETAPREEISEKEKELLFLFRQLNIAGQLHIIEDLAVMVAMPKYKKEQAI